MPVKPSISSSRTPFVPIRAGIPIVLASIAVCELTEPLTLTNDNIFSLSICTVSDGAKSSAMIIDGSSDSIVLLLPPLRIVISLSEISLTSKPLPLIYSSSIAANIDEKLSEVCATAYSALTF